MPNYRNDGATRLVVEGQPLEPGQTIETTGWYSISGLTKIADAPVEDPVILSQKVSGNTTVSIPATANGRDVQRYRIKIRGLTGAAGNTVTFNVAGTTPVLDVEDGDVFEYVCMGRTIVALIIVIAAGAIKVDVTRW